ncbi:hypothetical protein D3C87_1798470 [compost metagenome]
MVAGPHHKLIIRLRVAGKIKLDARERDRAGSQNSITDLFAVCSHRLGIDFVVGGIGELDDHATAGKSFDVVVACLCFVQNAGLGDLSGRIVARCP